MTEKWETSAGVNASYQTGVEWQVCEEGGGDAVAFVCDHPDAEKRANLMAAAPRMYRALKQTRDALGKVTDYGAATGENPDVQNRALDAAEVAICQAEGVQKEVPLTPVSLQAKIEHLLKCGFHVGDRDPRLNTDFSGRYMVAEPFTDDEVPTHDGSNGPWCIVGDDLPKLIEEAYEFASVMYSED